MHKLLGIAIAVIALWVNAEAATALKLTDSAAYVITPAQGKVENDSIKIDTTASTFTWNTVFRSLPGTFLPGKRYRLDLTCHTTKAENDSYLLLLVRPFANNNTDIATRSVPASEGETKVTLQFTVPKNPADYVFQIHTRKKITGYVKNISYEEVPPLQAQPLTGGSAGILPANLPTGAREFTVDLPHPQTNQTISVAEFGASPQLADNTTAFRAAIKACVDRNAGRLIVPAGRYCFTTPAPLVFQNMQDFELDGQGSTFIFSCDGKQISIMNCERTRFKNFNIDWDWEKDPLASTVKLERMAPDSSWIDLRFVDYKKFPVTAPRIFMLDRLDPDTLSVGHTQSMNFFFAGPLDKSSPRNSWIEPNLLRIFTPAGNRDMVKAKLQPGQLFRIPHRYYDGSAIHMASNRHLTLEDINIYSCAGFGMVAGGDQHHWQLLRVNITRPPNSKRPISCTADHLHIASSQGYLKIDGCDFGFGNDDGINIHDNTNFVRPSGPRSVQVQRLNLKIYQEGDPIELRQADYAPTGFTAPLRQIKTIDRNNNIYELVFDRPLPVATGNGFVIFNRRYDSHNIIIRNSFFHDNRARGLLLLARDVTVENCRFLHNQMGGIKIETGYTLDSWSEGFGAANIVLRNNRLESVNPMGCYINEMQPDIYISSYLRNDPSTEKTTYPIIRDILIENNQFSETTGAAVFVCSAERVFIRNNRISNQRPAKEECSFRGSIGVTYSSQVFVTGNEWTTGKFQPTPKCYVDTATTQAIYCWDNQIEKAP